MNLTSADCRNTTITCDPNASLIDRTLQWTVAPIVTLVNFILGVIGNSAILYLFVRTPDLRTSFNVYVMFLLGSNLFCVLLQYPVDIYIYTHSSVWQLGEHVCTFYLYVSYIGEGIVYHAHVLIALNRIVAVAFPIPYRNTHSFRSTILLCVGVLVYVHLCVGPGWALDALYYRLPLDDAGCQINYDAVAVWFQFYAIVMLLCPQAFIFASFPVIWVTRMVKRRKALKTRRVGPNPNNARRVRTGTDPHDHVSGEPTPLPERVVHRSSYGFRLLALLTISVTVFWTPTNIFYPLYTYDLINLENFAPISTSMFSCQTTMDPIVFTLALPALRQAALRRWFPGPI